MLIAAGARARASGRLRKEERQRSRIQSRRRICLRPIRESERNCCRRNYASDAFSLFLLEGALAASTSHRSRSNAGRCFINTPIVNCYHLIKSHFPRAFHDSADQEERLLRRSVIKTAALVPRLVCPLSPSLSLSLPPTSFSPLRFSLVFCLLSTPPSPHSLSLPNDDNEVADVNVDRSSGRKCLS